MSGFGGNGALCRFARLVGLAAGCLALANCSGGMSGKIDPKYGVAASARVVEPGAPVPKGGGTYRVGKPYVVAGREYVPQEDVNYSAVGMASWYGETSITAIQPMASVRHGAISALARPAAASYARVTNFQPQIAGGAGQRSRAMSVIASSISPNCAQLLGFHGNGWPGQSRLCWPRPLAGSDDRSSPLPAPAHRGIWVKLHPPDFAPAYFDTRPMTQVGRAPSPPERLYRLGEGARSACRR